MKSGLGVLRLFLGLPDNLELPCKGFTLALGEVDSGLLLINLDGPWLQFLLLDLDLVVEGTGFVCEGGFSAAREHSTVR